MSSEDGSTDDDIRDGLRSGDLDRAFRILRTRYGEVVYRACRSVLRDPTEADDARQDTFAKAFRKKRRLAAAESIGSYLVKIARNTAIDTQRKDSRRDRLRRENQRGEPDVVVLPQVAAILEPAEARALQECLDEMEPLTRQALLMHADGMSWQQIAAAVELPIDTIRMRVNRCIKGLRRCIEGKGHSP